MRISKRKQMAMRAGLKARLSEQGGHMTAQRAAVFDFLSRADHHPTAEDVYLGVKAALPKISLATVYKNLDALVACGMASKLTYGDGSARYEIRTDHHYHTRCLECGRVWDVDAREGEDFLRRIRPPRGFEVRDYRLELVGRCRDCKAVGRPRFSSYSR